MRSLGKLPEPLCPSHRWVETHPQQGDKKGVGVGSPWGRGKGIRPKGGCRACRPEEAKPGVGSPP